jgi:hypothetical protein
MPNSGWQAHSPQEWQAYLNNALAAHRANPNDTEAMSAVSEANSALNEHDARIPQPTSIGQDLSSVGSGAVNAAKALPGAMGQLLHQVGQGDLMGAARAVGHGLKTTAQAALSPLELAMRELGGESVPNDQRQQMLRQGGSALTGLEAMALPGQISRGVGALRGGGTEGPTPPGPSGPGGPIEPNPVTLGSSPSPVAGAPESAFGTPSNLPVQPSAPTGFERFGTPPAPAAGGMEAALSQLAQGLKQPTRPTGFTGNDIGPSEPETSGAPSPTGSQPNGTLTPRPDAPQGLDFNGPPSPAPAAPTQPTLADLSGANQWAKLAGKGTKGVTFGPESPLSSAAKGSVKDLLGEIARSRPTETGFSTPEMMYLLSGLGLGKLAGKGLTALPDMTAMRNAALTKALQGGILGATGQQGTPGIGNGNQ